MAHPIFPYSPPRELAPNLWQVKGSLKLPVPRNMTVFRDANGELVLYSVVAMHDDGMRALEALGRPAVMVIPHRRHQMDAAFYKERYPQLRVLAPEPARVPSVAVDGGLGELAARGITAYVLPGNTYEDVVMELPAGDGRALCVCESIGNVVLHGPLSAVLRVLGPPGGGPGIARAVRYRELRDISRLKDWLGSQSERADLKLLLFGHGDAITTGVRRLLRTMIDQL
ncbi:MAG TPA: hypothetical protein VH062_25695 [Polyangiaceae bacterium]|jgi:hypothetical protein|nr:hypothetical protein [Polyangiaceae bacterium]